MSDKYFLDTNVLAYSFDTQQPRKAEVARRLIQDALSEHRGVISYQVVQEFFSVAFRRFPRPPTTEEAQTYLNSVLRPLLAVQFSIDLAVEALHIRERYKLNWYDSLIIAAAREARCDVLYTEDLQDGQRFGDLAIRNPFRVGGVR